MKGSVLTKITIVTSIVAIVSFLIAGIIGAVTGVGSSIASPGFWSAKSSRADDLKIDEKKSVPLAQTDRVEIRVISEDVTVRASEGDSIDAWYHGTIGVQSRDDIPHLKVDNSGNTIRIYSEWKTGVKSRGWRNDIKLEISVPSKYSGALTADAVSADVTLGNHDFKELKLTTISGDIRADRLKTNNAKLRTTSGDVDAKGLTTDRTEIYSVSGDVETDALTGDVNAHSTSGEVALKLAKTPGRITADTISGDVQLAIPSDATFKLDAHSTSGDIACDFPITTTSSHKGAGNSTLTGTVGNGKGSVTINTISGDINIARS